jgi:hypothetical protein
VPPSQLFSRRFRLKSWGYPGHLCGSREVTVPVEQIEYVGGDTVCLRLDELTVEGATGQIRLGYRHRPGRPISRTTIACHTRSVRDWLSYEEAVADLSRLPPGERLQAVITEFTDESEFLPTEDIRRLFVYTWPDGRGSVDDRSPELMSMLQWIAPVRDHETYLVGTVTIFRAAADDRGVRWLGDEAAARAEMSDGTTLFRATIAASDVLGHFTGGGIDEMLVSPNECISIEHVEPSGRRGHRHRW